MDCKKVCKSCHKDCKCCNKKQHHKSECCEVKKHHEPLYCQCHQKKKCDCDKCAPKKVVKELLKDCMKIDWTVPRGQTQTIFQTGGLNQMIASGFVSYDRGDSPFVVVRFFLNGAQQGMDVNVYQDSSVAFSYTKFDQVTVQCPGTGQGTEDCEGQLSIISRFEVE